MTNGCFAVLNMPLKRGHFSCYINDKNGNIKGTIEFGLTVEKQYFYYLSICTMAQLLPLLSRSNKVPSLILVVLQDRHNPLQT